jgi:predicted permease
LPFDLAIAAPISVGLSGETGQAEELSAELVSENYFELLGVTAGRGRVFARGDDIAEGSNPTLVISDGLWQRRFARRPEVIGQLVSINARPFTIIGVAPAGFASLNVLRSVDAWIPTAMHQDALTGVQSFYFRQRSGGMFDLVARTPPTLTPTQAASMLDTQAAVLAEKFPNENQGLGFTTRPLRQARMNPTQQAMWTRGGWLMASIVGLVLLIASVNVANLLLARSVTRQRELAIRVAIGASLRQVRRQLLVESAMLSGAGALAGVGVAAASIRLLGAVRPAFIPASFEVSFDQPVFAFTGGVAILTTLAFGLVPAMRSARVDIAGALKDEGLAPGGLTRADFSRALLVAQSALATVAVVVAAIFARSLQEARSIDPGFRADNLAIVSFDLGMLRYDNTQGPDFVRRVNERMATISGVVSSAVSSHVILDGAPLASKIRLAGKADAEALSVPAQAVGLDYFRTLAIPLLEGRTFRMTDTGSSEFGWAIVNQTLAQQAWPNRPAIGQKFQVLGISEPYVVVGLVANSQYETLGEAAQPYFYIFYDQTPGLKKLSLFVRTANEPRAMLSTIEREIRAVDPTLPLLSVRTMADVLDRAMWAPRVGSTMLVIFAVMSLTLAATGIYGLTAFFVRRQWREIGIRTALGATRIAIVVPLMRRTLLPGLIGLVLGLLIAWLSVRAFAGLLIGIAPTDPASFAAAAAVFIGVSIAAALWPAIGAVRIDPSYVLRRE